MAVSLQSDQRVTHPYSLKPTTTCGSRAHKHELIFPSGEQGMGRKRESNSPSLSVIHVHLSSDHIPAPLPHNETVIPPHNEESGLGTSAACEGDETKIGPWESRSGSPSEWGNSFQSVREGKDTGCEMKFKQISSYLALTAHMCTCMCNNFKSSLLVMTRIVNYRGVVG